MEKEKFEAGHIKEWLRRQTIKEKKRDCVFIVAMRKARTGSKRAGRYLRRKYGILGLWNGERVVRF